MIKNEIPQGAQKTTGAYNSEIVELQSTVTRLENQIKDLLKARDEIEKGNHDSLKARQDRLDSVIVEQHKIKDIITTGTLELQKKVDAHESDKKAHNDAVIAHTTLVSDFEKQRQSFINDMKILEADLKSKISKNEKLFEELIAKENELNEKSSRINKLLNDIDEATKANEKERFLLESMDADIKMKFDALKTAIESHAADVLSHKSNVSAFESEKQDSLTRVTNSADMLQEARRLKEETDNKYLRLLDLRAETNQRLKMLAQQEENNQQTLQQLTELKEKLIQGAKDAEKPV